MSLTLPDVRLSVRLLVWNLSSFCISKWHYQQPQTEMPLNAIGKTDHQSKQLTAQHIRGSLWLFYRTTKMILCSYKGASLFSHQNEPTQY